MIGLNFVYEKDELLYSLDVHVEVGEQFSLDYLKMLLTTWNFWSLNSTILLL